MRWSTILVRFKRQRITAEQTRALDERIAARLAERKADREARQDRARRGAQTKVHQAYQNDALLHGRVQL